MISFLVRNFVTDKLRDHLQILHRLEVHAMILCSSHRLRPCPLEDLRQVVVGVELAVWTKRVDRYDLGDRSEGSRYLQDLFAVRLDVEWIFVPFARHCAATSFTR